MDKDALFWAWVVMAFCGGVAVGGVLVFVLAWDAISDFIGRRAGW